MCSSSSSRARPVPPANWRSSSGPRESSAILSHATSLEQPALLFSFVFHAPLCLALLQTRRFSFQFQTGRTTMSRPHTHLFHQMTSLSPRPSPPYKELAPLGLIESDQGHCSTSSVKKARMVSVPSKTSPQTNSFVRNKSLCSNWAFTCHL